MDNVQHRSAQRGLKPKTVFLPHSTWDKLGDILANAGGRCMGMVATGQEIVRKKKILQGQGKVREFHFESGKIYIFEKSQGKVKF